MHELDVTYTVLALLLSLFVAVVVLASVRLSLITLS
jgi:hypothetical protein